MKINIEQLMEIFWTKQPFEIEIEDAVYSELVKGLIDEDEIYFAVHDYLLKEYTVFDLIDKGAIGDIDIRLDFEILSDQTSLPTDTDNKD